MPEQVIANPSLAKVQTPAAPPTPEFPRYEPPVPTSPPPLPQEKKSQPTLKVLLPLLALVIVIAALIVFLPRFLKSGIPGSSGPVTLTYWGLFEPAVVFQEVVADYQKDHPRIKIDYQQSNLKDYRERLQSALARGQGPDLFRIHQSWVPMLGDLLEPLPGSVYSASVFEQTFYPSAKETLRYGGQYVAVPLYFDALVLFYNEDLFKAAGQAPPATWSDLMQAACSLVVRDNQGRIKTGGVALGTTNNVDHWSDILGLMLLQNGADPANPSQVAADALTFYTSFNKSYACKDNQGAFLGAVWDSVLPTSTYAFATGNLAMYFAPSWRAFDVKNLNPELNFKIVPVPQLPGNQVAWSTYWVEAVNKNSANTEAAWAFLQYLSSPEVLQRLYQAESALGGSRLFGEPFSRVEMADQLQAQPLVGAVIQQAPYARNWYLSSATNDNGLNDKISKYYLDAVNAVNGGSDPLQALTTVAQGVTQVLNQYGAARP